MEKRSQGSQQQLQEALRMQKLAERLDTVTRDIDPWNYGAEISENNGVEISKETLANDPYAVIEFLIDSVEMLLG